MDLELLKREAERMRRSRFYNLRKKDSHGNLKVRKYHVPVLPSYREIPVEGVYTDIQLPKGARFARLDTFSDGTHSLWFLAPEEEITEVRRFIVTSNDNAAEPEHGWHLVWLDSQRNPFEEEMLHAFEAVRTQS